MSVQRNTLRALTAAAVVLCTGAPALAQHQFGYRVLSTAKTSTMQKEMQEAADAGYRFADVMGGETAIGGSEVVVVMSRRSDPSAWEYRLLATNKTSTMQKELTDAAERGFEFVGLTVGKTVVGGDEVVSILRRQAR